jgi:hypothetical protein
VESTEFVQRIQGVAAESSDTGVDLRLQGVDSWQGHWREGEGRPHPGVGPALGVEREHLLEERGDCREWSIVGKEAHASRRVHSDPLPSSIDELLDGEQQELVLRGEEVPDRSHRQAGLSRHGAHRGSRDPVACDDAPHGLRQLRASGGVVDVDRHRNRY